MCGARFGPLALLPLALEGDPEVPRMVDALRRYGSWDGAALVDALSRRRALLGEMIKTVA